MIRRLLHEITELLYSVRFLVIQMTSYWKTKQTDMSKQLELTNMSIELTKKLTEETNKASEINKSNESKYQLPPLDLGRLK